MKKLLCLLLCLWLTAGLATVTLAAEDEGVAAAGAYTPEENAASAELLPVEDVGDTEDASAALEAPLPAAEETEEAPEAEALVLTAALPADGDTNGDHTHCPCGAAECSENGHDTDLTWTGVSSLGEINGNGNYYLTDNVSGSWTCRYNVKLCLNGKTVTGTAGSPSITVASGASLTISDCQPTAGTITHAAGAVGSGIEVASGGTLVLWNGTISGNSADSLGGGGVRNSGSFTMYGGAISGNNAGRYDGGGVINAGYSTSFTMYGGTISGNSAESGGGVLNGVGGTLTISGGSITGNIATARGGGGGVRVYSEGRVTLSGATTIRNNANGNLILPKDKQVSAGGLTDGACIYVTVSVWPADDSSVTITEGGASAGLFFSDDANYSFREDGNGKVILSKASETHHWDTAWSTDGNDHWYACTDSDCTAVSGSTPHIWRNGVCAVCYYPCMHSGATDDSDCTTAVVCGVCGGIKTAARASHTWSAWQVEASNTHSRHCTVEGCTISETGNCADADNDHRCDDCGKVISDHQGGTATCTTKAHCTICGAEYGELVPSRHSDLRHTAARAATTTAEGNIEYWHCDGCDRYYSDAAATKEITEDETVIAREPVEPDPVDPKPADPKPDSGKAEHTPAVAQEPPKTGDESRFALWCLLLLGGSAALLPALACKK